MRVLRSVLVLIAVALSSWAWCQGLDPAVARSLVDDVSRDVAALRGLEFLRPVSVEVVDDDGARARLLERLDRSGLRDDLAVTSRAYAALRLIPVGLDVLDSLLDAIRDQAGGFYVPESDTYFLLDDIDESLAGSVTAHELTHALEDQHFDLQARIEGAGDDDRLFAIAAVHEGSAMVVMTAWVALALREGRLDAAELQESALAEAARSETLDRLPEALRRQLLGPYVLGSVMVSGGAAGEFGTVPVDRLERLYADPPTSSEQLLHPELYWDAERRDDPLTVELGDAGAALGDGFERVGSGVLGELILAALLGSEVPTGTSSMLAPAASWTLPAAEGWGGDRWELWSDGERDVILLLTVWDDALEAEQFETAASLREGLTLRRRDDRVAVVAGTGPVPRAERVARRMLRRGRVERSDGHR